MSDDKPVHVRKADYPDIIYPTELPARLSEDPSESDIHLRDYWQVIVSRRWTIIATLLTLVTATMVYTFQQPPIYEAEATIQIDRENQNILSFKDVYEVEAQSDDTLQTQYKILASRALAKRVILDLKLDKSWEFAATKPTLLQSFRRSIMELLPRSANGPKTDSDPLSRLAD